MSLLTGGCFPKSTGLDNCWLSNVVGEKRGGGGG